MSRCSRAVVVVLTFVVFTVIVSVGQSTPTFQAVETHGIERINLSDLSSDLRILIRHKSGQIW